jgi:hypothetical protein
MKSSSSSRRSWAVFSENVRSLSDLRLLVAIAAFQAITPLLSRLRLDRLERILEPDVARTPSNPSAVEKVRSYTDYILRVFQPLLPSRCLTRGMTLYYFLRREGLDVGLCYGVGEPLGSFAGHCWVELEGEPFLELRDPRSTFTETYRIPAKQAPDRADAVTASPSRAG